MLSKKLYKSATDKKLCGVCAGIGEYFSVDPTLIRLVWLLFAMTGTGVLAYIACAIIVPEDPMNGDYNSPPPPSDGSYN